MPNTSGFMGLFIGLEGFSMGLVGLFIGGLVGLFIAAVGSRAALGLTSLPTAAEDIFLPTSFWVGRGRKGRGCMGASCVGWSGLRQLVDDNLKLVENTGICTSKRYCGF